MSVHVIYRGGRKRHEVKWRDHTGKQCSQTFDRLDDAEIFDADIKRAKQIGPERVRELKRGRMTLEDYIVGPWRLHAVTLRPATRDKYAWAIEKHLAKLVKEPLYAIDVVRLGEVQEAMLEGGATPSTVREVLARLGGIMQMATETGHLTTGNPVRALRKVPLEETEEVQALAPAEYEALLDTLTGRNRAIVLLGGRLGLRPGELRLAPWKALTDGKFTVSRTRTKRTARRTRVLDVDQLTAHDLKEWSLAAGRPGPDAPIIGDMTPNALKLWNRRTLAPAIEKVTGGRITGARVTTLRHTHASALHYAGFTLPAAARRMGHGPALHAKTYAHVIDGIPDGQRYDGLDALYAAARAQTRSNMGRTSGANS